MKNPLFFAFLLLLNPLFAQSEKPSYFLLSSDQLFANNETAALKDINSFVFLFSLQMNKEEACIILDFFNQELGKVGQVVKKEIFTDQGVDLDCFSLPRLKFSLAQLANNEKQLFPILKADLAVNSVVEVGKNKALIPTNTSTWFLYLNKDKETTLSALKKTLPHLLKSFVAEFIEANGTEKKPTFFIIYDPSWWKG